MADTLVPESPLASSLDDALSRLISFEPTTFPVISLYVDAQSDQHGRDAFDAFVRRELAAQAKTFEGSSPERQSFEADAEKIKSFLAAQVEPSANSVALFACHAAGLWETVQLSAPLGENKFYVYSQPHLYHLARVDDAYPRYAALVTDANYARLFLFGLGQLIESAEVTGTKMQRVKVGGWSQMRYQRRVENERFDHAKEAVDALDRLTRKEHINHIVVAGETQIATAILEVMPKELSEKVIDVVRIDAKNAGGAEILEKTLETMRLRDAETDKDTAARLIDWARGGGLACVGFKETLEALTNGQADELVISAQLDLDRPKAEPIEAVIAPEIPDASGSTESDEPRLAHVSDLLVTKAKQTAAKVTFIEDGSLLEAAGGVGAFLRWKT